jgi:hypothetical protein
VTRYSAAGEEVFAEQELSREELADYYDRRRWDWPRGGDRREVGPTPATWEPTEADVEAGREW